MADIEKLKTELSNLTVMEIADLVKNLEEEWGVSAAAPVAVAAAGGGGGDSATPAEEKSEFTVVLTDAGAKKIAVIKEIRALVSGIGLADAKKLSESVPATIKENIEKNEAEEIKKKLEAAGGTVELK